jgi:glycosyltransferase involved in cell wall biosynthesis
VRCNSEKKPEARRRLLVVESHYSLEAIRERGLESSVTCRNLDGFFEHVWTIHPFASLVTSEEWTSKYGEPQYHELSPSHTFIEGKVGRSRMLRGLLPLNFLLSQMGIIFDLVRLIRKEKISIIRAGDPLYNGLLGWALSRICGIPLLVRVGGNSDLIYEMTGRIGMPKLFRTRRIEKIFERFVLSRADIVAGATQNNLNFALANGAKPESSTLFRYGNLLAKQHLDEPTARPDGRHLLDELGVDHNRFFLTISRLESVKLLDDAVNVLADIRRRGYDFKAVIVGDGSLRETLIDLSRELGVKDQVVFCGNKDQEWLAHVIPLATVVVSPFMGRALTEVALGATPIVAYDIDWQSELIQTGVTGELVPLHDREKMTDAVERYLKNPTYARSMGSAVRKRVLEMMEPSKLDQHERDIYLGLLDKFQVQ